MAAMTMREMRFKPLPKQREFLEATEPELLYSGSFAAGKSRVLCEKALMLSMMYPGNVGLICRKFYSDLPATTMKTFFEEVCPPDAVIGQNKSEHWVKIRTNDTRRPSIVYFRGLDRPTGVASMNLGFAGYDEAIEGTEAEWTMLEGRLRLTTVPFRQLFGATNPGAPSHWLYKRFFDSVPKDEVGNSVRRVVTTNVEENHHNPTDFNARLRRFQGVFRERYVFGRWVGAEGLVYPEFDPTRHVVKRFPIPADWPRWRAIDFGTANPTCVLFAAKSPVTDQIVIYRQIYRSGLRMAEQARRVVDLSKGETYQATVADHDLAERKDFEAEGVKTQRANKDVREGIQRVKSRLAIRDDGLPGIVIFEDSLVETDLRLEMEGKPTRLEQEFGSYSWAKGAHDTDKDEPLKKDDHGMDTLRYLVAEIDVPRGAYKVASHLGGYFR